MDVIQIFCESLACTDRQTTVITNGGNPKLKTWLCPTCGSKARVRRRLSLIAYQAERLDHDAMIKRLRHWR
jgi:hypothetical protein